MTRPGGVSCADTQARRILKIPYVLPRVVLGGVFALGLTAKLQRDGAFAEVLREGLGLSGSSAAAVGFAWGMVLFALLVFQISGPGRQAVIVGGVALLGAALVLAWLWAKGYGGSCGCGVGLFGRLPWSGRMSEVGLKAVENAILAACCPVMGACAPNAVEEDAR